MTTETHDLLGNPLKLPVPKPKTLLRHIDADEKPLVPEPARPGELIVDKGLASGVRGATE